MEKTTVSVQVSIPKIDELRQFVPGTIIIADQVRDASIPMIFQFSQSQAAMFEIEPRSARILAFALEQHAAAIESRK